MPVMLWHRVHRSESGIGGSARVDHAYGQLDTCVTDVRARACNQLAELMLRSSAECAGQDGTWRTSAALANTASLDDLMNLLLAEPQRGGDAHRLRAAQDEPAHSKVEFSPRSSDVRIGIGQAVLGLPSPGQQPFIHTAHSS
jgi:hypothetical protein